MDYLWTPWRYQYITTAAGKPGECIFCAARENPDDREPLVVHRAERNLIILNRFPYTNGHVMVAPYEHVASLEDLSPEAATEMIALAQTCVRHLKKLYHPEGMNLGMNLGTAAGAGIASHLHLHILPRWNGDTSFITTVSETRVLPESLDATWERLRAEWRKPPACAD